MRYLMREIIQGKKYPYHNQEPIDWAEEAACGILYDLSDRRGIGRELERVDPDTRKVITETMATIIRYAGVKHFIEKKPL